MGAERCSIPIPDEIYDAAVEKLAGLRAVMEDASPGIVLSDATITSATLDFAREALYAHWAEATSGVVRHAILDPGKYVERIHTEDHLGKHSEPLYQWQARAVQAALGLEDRT